LESLASKTPQKLRIGPSFCIILRPAAGAEPLDGGVRPRRVALQTALIQDFPRRASRPIASPFTCTALAWAKGAENIEAITTSKDCLGVRQRQRHRPTVHSDGGLRIGGQAAGEAALGGRTGTVDRIGIDRNDREGGFPGALPKAGPNARDIFRKIGDSPCPRSEGSAAV